MDNKYEYGKWSDEAYKRGDIQEADKWYGRKREQEAIADNLFEEIRAVNRQKNEKMRRLVEHDGPGAQFEWYRTGVENQKSLALIEDGTERFRRLVREWPNPDANVEFNNVPGVRAHCKGRKRSSTVVFDGAGDTFDVIVHELGHSFEDANPERMRESAEFLYRRTKGEKAKKMSSWTGNSAYKNSEKAWKDDFDEVYTGKDYRWNYGTTSVGKAEQYTNNTLIKDPRKSKRLVYGTEISSMGLQWMAKDPFGFSQKDPDFFDFIYERVMQWTSENQ